MSEASIKEQIDEATLDFTMGDSAGAVGKLEALLREHPDTFGAWHALTEVHYAEGDYDKALEAGEKALALNPDDVHINTSLSRIWVARGDKDKAEHYGAQARMLGWKEQLKSPPGTDEDDG